MADRPRRTTMQDLAERAGVSVATVSRALSGHTDVVRPELVERVRQAAEEVGYRPNHLARNMRVGSSRLLSVVVSDVTNPFFTGVVRGCEDIAQRNGYSLVLANTDDDPSRESAILELMAAERAAGVLVLSTNQVPWAIRGIQSLGIPVVAIDRRAEGVAADLVAVDNQVGASEAIEHLIRLGHRRIAIVTGSQWLSSFWERTEGYKQALRDHGIAEDSALVVQGDLTERGGYSMTMGLFELAEPPTAVFCANNLTALGCLGALRELDVRVPSDVSVISFDDFPAANLIDPPLTVVEQPTYEIGVRAVEMLIQRTLDRGAPVRELRLATRFVIRDSTAPVSPRKVAR